MSNQPSSSGRLPAVRPVPVEITSVEQIRTPVLEQLALVDQRICESLHSEVALVNEISTYIVDSGGKRLRPLLVLLGAEAFGQPSHAHIDLAAILEFIHTATLLHDDVVDASSLRRGNQTANAVWGNEASVLVGDFLYSRAFQMLVEVGSMRIMEIMAHTTNVIAEGEVLQLLNCNDPDTTEERYLEVIRSKTAKLFEAGAMVGAVLAARSTRDERNMANYGLRLGTAYQLVDDVLDYRGATDSIGKNIGDDLAQGKPTLPLIHAMRTGSPSEVALVRRAIEHGESNLIADVIDIVESTGGIAYTARAARHEADCALKSLADVPESLYKQGLEQLAEFAISRTY
jgi:octaprenyl-diphosphate synthase